MSNAAPVSVAILAYPEATASVVYGMYDLFRSAGRDWGMPSPPERYLEDCYGADWRAQWRQVGDTGYDMRHSDTQVSNPSRTAESLPRAVTLALLRLARALQAANWPKAHAMCLQLLAREDIAEVVAIRAALDAAGHAPRRA